MDLIYQHTNGASIWQSGYSQIPWDLRTANIDVVFYMAAECPPLNHHQGAEKIYCPNWDSIVAQDSLEYAEILSRASLAADQAVARMQEKKNVLITCSAGINRSSLVTCLALKKLTGRDGEDVIALIRAKRPGTLSNPTFVVMLTH